MEDLRIRGIYEPSADETSPLPIASTGEAYLAYVPDEELPELAFYCPECARATSKMSATCSPAAARPTSNSLARSCVVTALLPRHRPDRLAQALRPGRPGAGGRGPSRPVLRGTFANTGASERLLSRALGSWFSGFWETKAIAPEFALPAKNLIVDAVRRGHGRRAE